MINASILHAATASYIPWHLVHRYAPGPFRELYWFDDVEKVLLW